MNLLVTGGAGFIGSHFIRYWNEKCPQDKITVLDLLDYSGNSDFIDKFKKNRNIVFVKGDICDKELLQSLVKDCDSVFHFAAQTHVDRSIQTSEPFIKTNVLGTQTLLETSRQNGVKKFIYISTDEVYGSFKKGKFNEDSPLKPSSPYSASKAAGDLLCLAYWQTYRFPVVITRCSNNFGPDQFPEKVIPVFITHLLENKKIPLYGNGKNIREWIYVLDHCQAIETIFKHWLPGEVYNIGSGVELTNVELARHILDYFNLSKDQIEWVPDRPGHDFRYALNSNKLKKLGWKPKHSFLEQLIETIEWYKKNQSWWRKIKEDNAYQKYFNRQYPTLKVV